MSEDPNYFVDIYIGHLRRLSPEEERKTIERIGFKGIVIETNGPHHYLHVDFDGQYRI